MNSHDIIM